MRRAVIFNPTARGGHAEVFRSALRALGEEVTLLPTTAPGSASLLAQHAAREGSEVIVAAGGDGTVNEVVDGLAREPALLEQVRLGIVPLGTINVLARELGIPLAVKAACALIRSGHERRIDLPRVEFTADGAPRRRAFTQLAGAGLDSRAIDLVRWEVKQRFGWLAYAWAGCRALRGPHPVVQVDCPHAAPVSGHLAVIGNGTRYGGDVRMFPQASLQDGRLDLRLFRRVNTRTLLRFGWAWIRRRPLLPADDLCLQGTEFTLSSDRPLRFQLDGDNVGWLPARFTVQPRALRVLVPRAQLTFSECVGR